MRLIHLTCLSLALLLTGCGHKEGDGHDHDGEGAHKSEDGHDHGHAHGESPSGASFKAGKGVSVTEETKKLLGLETTDIGERNLPNEIRFTVQIFGEKHHHLEGQTNHSGCDVHGSGLVPLSVAEGIKSGQVIEVVKNPDAPLSGVVLSVQKAAALGESEIVVGITNAADVIASGEFVPARIRQPRQETVVAIPQAALLRTAEGTFVYAVNGDAYLRTSVKTGAKTDGWVEVTDGLLAGDAVVVTPVETLWLIELRATKGGGHSH